MAAEQEAPKPKPSWKEQLKSLSGGELKSGIRFFQDRLATLPRDLIDPQGAEEINSLKRDIAGQMDLAAQNQNKIANPGIIIDIARRAIGLGIAGEVSLPLGELGKNRAVVGELHRRAAEAENNPNFPYLAAGFDKMQELLKVAEAFGWDKDTNPQSLSSRLLNGMKGYISANQQEVEDRKFRHPDATLASEAAEKPGWESQGSSPQLTDELQSTLDEMQRKAPEQARQFILRLHQKEPYKLLRLIHDGFFSPSQIATMDYLQRSNPTEEDDGNNNAFARVAVSGIRVAYVELASLFVDYSDLKRAGIEQRLVGSATRPVNRNGLSLDQLKNRIRYLIDNPESEFEAERGVKGLGGLLNKDKKVREERQKIIYRLSSTLKTLEFAEKHTRDYESLIPQNFARDRAERVRKLTAEGLTEDQATEQVLREDAES